LEGVILKHLFNLVPESFMITVTGAPGHLGRLIVEKLVQLVPSNYVGVSVRDVAKATDLEGLGVRVRQSDFDKPDSLQYAFKEATQVLIVSSNARVCGGDPLEQHRLAIEAARAAGARRVVYTSHTTVSAFSALPPMRDGIYAASGVAMGATPCQPNGFKVELGARTVADALLIAAKRSRA
jgi:uncharacterized protein YbjT (DUF2867 family)